MTMTAETAWAHLPNAKHIDAVLADVKARPEAWAPTYRVSTRAEVDVLIAQQKESCRTEMCAAVISALTTGPRSQGITDSEGRRWTVRTTAAESSALGSIYALILWDSAADLLDCTPDVLRAMVDMAEPPVCHQAALLLPYAIVRFGA